MERCNGKFQMLNYIIPVVLFCAVGDIEGSKCDARTAFDRHSLKEETTPMACLRSGMEDAAKFVADFRTEHPNKEVEFRIICKSSEKA